MPESISLIIFASGAAPENSLLSQMHAVRQACARDLLERAIEACSFDPIIVVTGDRVFADTIGHLPVTIDLDDADGLFHFGRRLAEVIDRFELTRALYMGAASAPLLTSADLAEIAEVAQRHARAVIANNINSTDWAAITPTSIVRKWVDMLPSDNSLGWVLSHEAGLEPIGWTPSPATRLDLDVPIDAQIAARHPQCGLRVREAVRQLPWDDDRLRAASEVLRTRASRVILAGRVPSWSVAQMEKTVQCWTRVYSEERGMRAAGRLAGGQVRSLLSDHLHAVGLSRFLSDLCSMADTMLWDTRVLWAANGVWPSEEDRYAADLGLVEAISDPFTREFTQAVLDAPIPIVTGGHSLVSGGLWALLESLSGPVR
jgi:hypothetical protein